MVLKQDIVKAIARTLIKCIKDVVGFIEPQSSFLYVASSQLPKVTLLFIPLLKPSSKYRK
jgi:hypothetical protein